MLVTKASEYIRCLYFIPRYSHRGNGVSVKTCFDMLPYSQHSNNFVLVEFTVETSGMATLASRITRYKVTLVHFFSKPINFPYPINKKSNVTG
ncbi:hypothetical protein WDU94_002892 [Cyamophila willieti]